MLDKRLKINVTIDIYEGISTPYIEAGLDNKNSFYIAVCVLCFCLSITFSITD